MRREKTKTEEFVVIAGRAASKVRVKTGTGR